MKKTICVFIVIVVLNPLFVRAVQWQKDSSPFTFSGVGIAGGVRVEAKQIALRCIPETWTGSIILQGVVPQSIASARLSIIDLHGAILCSWKMTTGQNTIRWNYEKTHVGTGIYLAVMRYGTTEQLTRISIVK